MQIMIPVLPQFPDFLQARTMLLAEVASQNKSKSATAFETALIVTEGTPSTGDQPPARSDSSERPDTNNSGSHREGHSNSKSSNNGAHDNGRGRGCGRGGGRDNYYNNNDRRRSSSNLLTGMCSFRPWVFHGMEDGVHPGPDPQGQETTLVLFTVGKK
jgi:hypothetical protein